MNKKQFYPILFLSLSVAFFYSCSSEKNTVLNKAYHNTTAHYNAYFYGLEDINKVKQAIKIAQQPDYDHILRIFPSIDSTYKETYKAELEDCIKKASLVIQYHKNSKWVDDSYNLIGLARMYGYDFPNAIETFKYVNTKGEDNDAKHFALVNLMRTFIENNDMANAEAVSDYLDRQLLNKENLKNLYLMRAYYYQILDQKDNMVRNLVRAEPLLNKKEKSRLFFLIGQVYQEIGFESAAYDYYQKCVRSNPEYELSFYAKLNMAQVTRLDQKQDLKSIRKYFKKLVKDEKNREFKDRIYHEWAKFELKQGHLSEAIRNFNLSIRSSQNNPRIKGLSYLNLGEVYFDSLKDYSLAQAYYDSAVTTLPKTFENYEAVVTRSEVLTRFVEQINTITLQDSLLALSAKDSAELMNIFTLEAERREEQKAIAEEKARKKETAESFFSFNQEPTGIGGGSWYFTNASAVSSGRAEFKRIWGERPLEDHWRRSVKISVTDAANNITLATNTSQNQTENEETNSIDQIAQEFLKQVPRTPEQIAESHKKLENAYYNLGGIYHFELNEDKNATETYSKLLKNYPETEYEPEVLYLLYLMENELGSVKATKYKELIFEKYPNSLYANLIVNPKYVEESDRTNEQLEQEYKKAYTFFKNGDYESAQLFINKALKEYPNADFTSNFALLNALILGKTASLPDYQLALKSFIKTYPESKLNSYAQTLLDASENYQNRLVQLESAHFSTVLIDEAHYFVVVADSASIQKDNEVLTRIINSEFGNKHLSIGTLKANNGKSYIVVKSLFNKEEALLFYDSVKAEQTIEDVNFVISKSNFEVLYKTKELDTYLQFFENNY
ncbi:MAG: tetratricopeptide repeat protein [Cyclobacteriaceae bacterium]|nr:tetratricopeptide repeat protein [Cyclobacteriaceae bacterium]